MAAVSSAEFSLANVTEQTQEDTVDIRADRVKDLVSFLEYSLNTIGSIDTPPREKDVIITQSYTKFFRDEDVQVEDDLDPDRSTITNKDVQAYLKDIDFFFKDVTFELEIDDIEQLVNDSSQLFYLVRLNRNLSGVTLSGDSVNRTITRFLEINYDQDADDLKIVSFYTTKLSEKEDLMMWWEELSFEWKYIFQSSFNLYDSIGFEQIKMLTNADSLNLSSNQYVDDFEPLFRLNQLRYLNLSYTNISDLSPLRIHNKLEYLDISHTEVSNLDYLKYASRLKYLNAARTDIKNINILANFTKLTELDLSECNLLSPPGGLQLPGSLKKLVFTHAALDSYHWLSELPRLAYLDLSFGSISDLSPLASLKTIEILLLEGTSVADISFLSGHKNLDLLNIEGTHVDNIDPLGQLTGLKKVYCDNSQVTRKQADSFMNKNPGILIIFESEHLREWWADLDIAWKNILRERFSIDEYPEKDELARLTQIDSLDISGNEHIFSLEGIELLNNLRYLNIRNTYVRDINAVTTLVDLRYLDAGFTNVASIDSIFFLKNLVRLNLESTRISSIRELFQIRGIKHLNIDHTRVDKAEIREFISQNPECLVIHNTTLLQAWWNDLTEEWKNLLVSNAPEVELPPDKAGLHRVSYLRNIHMDSVAISDLGPLKELSFLEELVIKKSLVADLSPLTAILSLKKLVINQSPVRDLSPVVELQNLVHLDISNTGVSDIDVLEKMEQLKVLKLSGIQIRNLKPVEELSNIRQLDISNTRVRSLRPIEENYNLELLVCYNTRLNDRRVDNFKSIHPDCKVVFY